MLPSDTALSGLSETASAGDAIAVGGPEHEGGFQTAQHRLLSRMGRRVIHNHFIGVMAMTGFHRLVGTDQVHGIGREAVMFDQRMLLNDRLNLLGTFPFRRFGKLVAVFYAAFDEYG